MANKKKSVKGNTAKKKQPQKDYLKIHMIVFSVLTAALALLMYVNTDGNGIINIGVTRIVCGLFGKTGYLLPIALGGATVYLFKTKDIKRFWIKLTLIILLLINISAFAGLYNNEDLTNAYYLGANDKIGGGIFGTCVSVLMTGLVHIVISYLILIFTLIALAGAITGISFFSLFSKGAKDAYEGAKDKVSHIREEYEEYKENEEKELDDAENEKEQLTKPEHRQKRKRKPKNDELPEDSGDALDVARSFDKNKNGEASGMEDIDVINNLPPVDSEAEESDGVDEVFSRYDITGDKEKNTENEAEQPEEIKEEKKKEKKMTQKEKDEYSKELDEAIDKPHIEYVYPPINLLKRPKSTTSDLREELRNTAKKLISILDDFGVKAKLLQVTQGPTVTRFEIQPETGIKLSKIVGLADDIALNLAVSTVLVAPVPGKAAVGIEIPNNKVSAVSIREILDTEEFKNAKSKLAVAIGKDIGGKTVVGDIAKMPHVLIAGATGSGKSVCINTIITSILYKASPEDVKLIMVDPKVVELGVYNGIPHLLIPVVTDPKKAAGALNWAVAEMMKRYELFKETGVRKLESYNKLMESRGEPKIPQLVIIIDELADLMMVAAKEVEDYVCRLAQLARAAGIHLIIATQRPSVDVITGLIKANIPSRIAFAVSSQVDSRTILDKGGAEKLLGMGDMLYHPTGARTALRVQGAFVSDEEIENILDFIREHSGEMHYSEDLEEQIEKCASGDNGVTPDEEDDGDSLLPDAISLAVELGKISTSMVQRRLGVGYSRAGRIIDQMEARGIISGANGSKPRDVLINHADMPMGRMSDE